MRTILVVRLPNFFGSGVCGVEEDNKKEESRALLFISVWGGGEDARQFCDENGHWGKAWLIAWKLGMFIIENFEEWQLSWLKGL